MHRSGFRARALQVTRTRSAQVDGARRRTMERMGLRHGAMPGFLVIGAMKAGTTSFYEWASTHPLVPPASAKELHYFDIYFGRGGDWYRTHFETERRLQALTDNSGHRAIVGEATPNYLFHPLVPRRVQATIPDVKLVVLLRNPVDRAYSHYNTNIRHDWEALSFEQALDREETRLDGQIDAMLMDQPHHRNFPRYRWSYHAMGRYAESLELWFRYFPRDQFLFVLNEDMARDPDLTFRRVWNFLELPYHPVEGLRRRVVGHYPQMAPDTRARLQEYFRPYNAQLAELIKIDPGWT